MKTFELTDEETETLTLALGIAAGAAESPKLVWSIIALANAVHRNNPNWTKYEIPTGESK